MLPEAFIVHELEGRLRLRLPSKRGDAGWFQALEGQLQACPGVEEVSGSPLTGAVLILHRSSPAQIAAFALEHELFQMIGHPLDKAYTSARLGVSVQRMFMEIDARVLSSSRGQLDLRSLTFLSLVTAAGVQFVRGRIMPVSVALLSYALSVLPPLEECGIEPAGGGRGTPEE